MKAITSFKREIRALYKPKARQLRRSKHEDYRHEIEEARRPDTADSYATVDSGFNPALSSQINIFEALNSPPMRTASLDKPLPTSPSKLQRSPVGVPEAIVTQRDVELEQITIEHRPVESIDVDATDTNPIQVEIQHSEEAEESRPWTEEEAQGLRDARYLEFCGEDETDYTEGPARLVPASDGVKEDCAALLMTLDLSAKIQAALARQAEYLQADELALKQTQALTRLQRKVGREIMSCKSRLAGLKEDDALQSEEAVAVQHQMDTLELLLDDVKSRSQNVELNLKARADDLREAQAAVSAYLEEAFVSALLVVPATEQAPEPVDEYDLQTEYARFAEQLNGGEDDDFQPTSPPPLDTTRDYLMAPPASAEDQAKQAITDTLWHARETLKLARRDFEIRDSLRADDFAANVAAAARGDPIQDDSPAAFDVRWVARYQELTHALIEAEAEFKAARLRALEAGVEVTFDDQSSVFGEGEVEDGYAMSFEQEVGEKEAPQSPGRVGRWLAAVPENAVGDFVSVAHEREGDEWEAQEVGISDSVSIIACGKERSRIDRWREIAGQGVVGQV